MKPKTELIMEAFNERLFAVFGMLAKLAINLMALIMLTIFLHVIFTAGNPMWKAIATTMDCVGYAFSCILFLKSFPLEQYFMKETTSRTYTFKYLFFKQEYHCPVKQEFIPKN